MIEQRPNRGESIPQLIALRNRTDYRILPTLVIFSVLSWLLWIVWIVEAGFSPLAILTNTSASFILSLLGLLAFGATVPVSYLIFSIVNRRNQHFGRSEALLNASIERLMGQRITSNDSVRLYAANSADRDLAGLRVEEKERSGYLLSLLTLIPFVGWLFLNYALYRVDRDFRTHEQREFAIIEEVERGLGMPVSPIPVQTRNWYPSRNSMLYFFVSLITLGLFSIVWLYLATGDPEPHFQVQSRIEDQMQPLLAGLH